MVLVPSSSMRVTKAPEKSGYLDVHPRPSVEGPPEYSVVDRYSYASISSARTSPVIPTRPEREEVTKASPAPDGLSVPLELPNDVPLSVAAAKPLPLTAKADAVSELFCAPDADTYIYSKDGVLFRVYRANLLTFSSNFPGSRAIVGPDQSISVPEHSEVLNVLLQFMRNQRPPDLDKVKKFETVAKVALAVEKYEVHQSVQLLRMYMKNSIKKHPFEVLQYAFKCGNLELADQAAEQTLLLGTTINVIRPPLRGNALLYYMLWREQFTTLLAVINTPPPPTKHPRSTFSSHKASHLHDQCYAPVIWAVHGDPGVMFTRLKSEIQEREEEAGGGTTKGMKGGALKCSVCRKDWDVWKEQILAKLEGIKKFGEFVPATMTQRVATSRSS